MAGFSALPAAVQWRVVQLIEAREDEADARELQAIREARSTGAYPDDTVPWEKVKAELAARDHAHARQSTDLPQAQAA